MLSPAAPAPLGACRALTACWLELMATPATCPLASCARSLAEFGPYKAAPATCPRFRREVSGGVGPYFALGRVRATFAPGSDSVAGRPLLRVAATLNGSSILLGHDAVSYEET